MEESLKTLLSDLFALAPQQIGDDFAMKDNEQWDSLKHMELISALEDRFQVEFDFEEIVKMQDLGSIKTILEVKATAA